MTPTRPEAPAAHAPLRRRPRWPSILGAIYALAAIAALVAWWLAGDAAWIQPVNLMTFWWSLPAVVLAPLAFLLGSRRTAFLLAVPAAVWVWSYGTAFVPSAGAGDADLRVATFNTYVQTPDTSHVLDLVRTQEPDILLLQEVFPERQTALEAELAETMPYSHVVQTGGVGGVGVFSRFPIREVRPVGDATTRSRSTAVVVLDVDGQLVQVAPVHLISPCPTCGASVVERLELEGDVRLAEIDSVIDTLDPSLPAIVGGDFNSTDRSGPYRELTHAGFADPQRDAGAGPGFTWPNGGRFGPFIRIDWLLTRGFDAVEAFVAPGGGSDHRPVVVDLSLPEGS